MKTVQIEHYTVSVTEMDKGGQVVTLLPKSDPGSLGSIFEPLFNFKSIKGVPGETRFIRLQPDIIRYPNLLGQMRNAISAKWRDNVRRALSDTEVTSNKAMRRFLLSSGSLSPILNPFTMHLTAYDTINFNKFSSTWLMPQIFMIDGIFGNLRNSAVLKNTEEAINFKDGLISSLSTSTQHLIICTGQTLRRLLSHTGSRLLSKSELIHPSEFMLSSKISGVCENLDAHFESALESIPTRIQTLAGQTDEFTYLSPTDWVSAGGYPASYGLYIIHKIVSLRRTMNLSSKKIKDQASFSNMTELLSECVSEVYFKALKLNSIICKI